MKSRPYLLMLIPIMFFTLFSACTLAENTPTFGDELDNSPSIEDVLSPSPILSPPSEVSPELSAEPSIEPSSTSEPSPSDTESPSTESPEPTSIYDFYQLLELGGSDIAEVIDVLGGSPELVSETGVYLYDGIYFHTTNSVITMVYISPSRCVVNGISLEINKEELIALFGFPKAEWYDEEGGPYFYCLMLDFEIQGRIVRFGLDPTDEKVSFMEI